VDRARCMLMLTLYEAAVKGGRKEMIVYMPLCYQCSVITVLLVPVGDTWLVATAKADNQGFLSGRPCQRAIADLTGPVAHAHVCCQGNRHGLRLDM
jgi:hypothetical protein